MEDLSAAGYKTSTPEVGDYIMAINETLGIRKRVRIVSLESNYDVSGKLIKRKVVCNDVGSVQRYSSEMSVLSRSVSDSKNESSKAIETAIRALVSAEGKNTNYFGDKKPLDNPPGTIKKGDRLFLTAGDETELYFWSGSEWVIEPTRFDKDKFNVEFDKKVEAINKNIQQVESKAATALATAGANASLIEETQKISEQAKKQLDLQFADYKQSVDGRFASLSIRVDDKANLVDFQRVQETSKLYERIIGSSESDIAEKVSRMAMTSQLFQVEVGKYANAGGPNMLRNSRADDGLKYWSEANGRLSFTAHTYYFNGQKRMFELRPGAVVTSPRFIVKRNADYIFNILGFDNNSKYFRVYFCKRKKGSSANFEQKQLVFDGKPRWVDGPVFDNMKAVKKTFKFNVGDFDDGYLQFEYDRNNPNKWGGLFMTELDFYEGENDRKWQPAPEDATMETDEAVRTVQTQLAGSWAVQNLNSAGDLISGLNLGANGHNRLDGKLTHITGETLIDNAVIKSAMIESVLADKITTGTLNAANVNIINLNANKIVGLDATFLRGKIENAIIDWLVGKTLISQNGSTTLNLQTGVFTLNNEDSSITFSRSSDNTATSFSKNGIHFFKNRKIIASIGQSAFSSIYDNKHKSGFSITLPNDQGISFSGYDSSPFFEINPYEKSLSIQSGFSLLIGIKTSQSVSLEHFFGTANNVNFSGFRAKGTRRQALLFYADGRIEITTRG